MVSIAAMGARPPKKSIYLDSHASEKPRPEAKFAVSVALSDDNFGNASALTSPRGQRVLSLLEESRNILAITLNADPEGIIFTATGTEANNLIINSLVATERGPIVASEIEHGSIIKPLERARANGTRVQFCPVDSDGRLRIDALGPLAKGAALVSTMHANNEIGTLQSIAAIREAASAGGALLHVDAAQTFGKVEVDFRKMNIDFMTISSHKFGGVPNVGALIVKPSLLSELRPQIIGGNQEGGLRAGTQPVALVHAMAAAAFAACDTRHETEIRHTIMRDRMIAQFKTVPGFFVNGSLRDRLACNLSCGFEGIDADVLMRRLQDIHFARGSACAAGNARNHVLDALGISLSKQRATFRIGLSWATTAQEVDIAIQRILAEVHELRLRPPRP